jgi:hypothetical protein
VSRPPAPGGRAGGGRSPWEAALGGEIERLHPRLRAYTGPVPEGAVGRGTGVFDVAGAPHRLLWPLLLPLSAAGVLHPAYETHVPFRIVNRRGDGPSVRAERTLLFASGPWTMRDRIGIEDGRLVDALGPFRVSLSAAVRDGRLLLVSTGVAIRIGRWRIPVPRLLAPELRLEERYDDGDERQHVHLRLRSPLAGVLYEYRGGFTYAIEEADG